MNTDCIATLSSGIIDNSPNVQRILKYAFSKPSYGNIKVSVTKASSDKAIPNKCGKQRRITLTIDCGALVGSAEEISDSDFPLAKHKIDDFLSEYGFKTDDFFVSQCIFIFAGSRYLSASDADKILSSVTVSSGQKENYRDFGLISVADSGDDDTFIGVKLSCKRAAIEWFRNNKNVPQDFDHWVNKDVGIRLINAAKLEFGNEEFWDYIAS